MTLRGLELLKRADVVIYDHLVSTDLLKFAKSDSLAIDAGKSGSNHTLSQDEINSLLISHGKSGKTVVRLKGGDPYIFGRGAEEAMELQKEGIPFEVIPGVSSAIAAANAAGIPLTHRDLTSQVVIMTGHEKPGKARSAHHWPSLAKMGALVVVMGSKNLPYLAERLIEAGKDPKTPAAAIQWGFTYKQKVAVAPLSDIALRAQTLGLGPPCLVVVGEVVTLREKLDWFEKRPLFGRRILITRTRTQASRLSALLKEQGAEVIEKPVIQIEEITSNPDLAWAIENVSDYQWLIFTSPNGATIFLNALFASHLDSRALNGVKIAVIGAATADSLKPFGLKPDLTPKKFISEGLLEAFKTHLAEQLASKTVPPGRCLVARAQVARDALITGLTDLGFEPAVLPLYRTTPAAWDKSSTRSLDSSCDSSWDSSLDSFGQSRDAQPALNALLRNPPDLTTLTSASTAQGLASIIPQRSRSRFPVVSIGPITSQAAREHGFTVACEAQNATIEEMLKAIVGFLARNSQ
jgi:uroporphyrinogen III methyltransferase/synthase